jgi:hypothetical protein
MALRAADLVKGAPALVETSVDFFGGGGMIEETKLKQIQVAFRDLLQNSIAIGIIQAHSGGGRNRAGIAREAGVKLLATRQRDFAKAVFIDFGGGRGIVSLQARMDIPGIRAHRPQGRAEGAMADAVALTVTKDLNLEIIARYPRSLEIAGPGDALALLVDIPHVNNGI